MRVATFNILNGRTASDDQVDPGVLQEAVASLDADVLALQEVDRNQPRSGHADLTAAAADAMGAVDHRFVAALSGSPGATWIAATGREQPDAAAYGIALLSRYPVSAWEVIRLPTLHTRVPMWFDNPMPTLVRDEPRVAMAAVVETPDGLLTVANTHLSFVPWWGGRQLRALVTSLNGVARPLVLMGDLNMGPGRAAGITGMRSLVDAPTFPADAPREQLDLVLADGSWQSVKGEARQLPLSDHRALVVDLE
ncbi:endonuclease/exonuclease/phosphatase family protein [Aeromicrobium sp.]|uniref:endonuclease/exonuclease/phosphatase family protein n=1 Tax=Aeromicrobium sp. TaxID=1871063 RepID=UPI002FC5828E